MNTEKMKKEIVYWSEFLNRKGLVTARSGNVSSRVEEDKILITSHDCYLGHLEENDILLVDLEGNVVEGKGTPTSEKSLHLNIHKKFKESKVIIHAHPPYTTAFFNYFDELDIFSFEARFYLPRIKPIPQSTPTVTEIGPVLYALENSNIVVLRNHGVVSMGKDFKEAFSLIELLEQQAEVNLLIKSAGVKKEYLAPSDEEPVPGPEVPTKYILLSKAHVDRLVELINDDTEVQKLGKHYNLTCTLAIKNEDSGQTVCFHYVQGRIVKVDDNEKAEFLIAGKEEVLKKVFNREIDPFVASTQGKVRTEGDLAKISRWYPVMEKTFKLWEQAPVE